MPVQWTEDLATGIERIDQQHQELYQQVAALHDAMRAGRMADVPATLEFLERYVVEHFTTEEREMAAARYPGLDLHRRRHLEFVEDLRRRQAALAAGPTVSAVVDLSHWLVGWLREHVRQIDGDMARYLRQDQPRRHLR